MTTPEGCDAHVTGVSAAPETPKSPPPAASVRMTVGPRPDPPSVVVSVPSGYEEPAGTLQVEVSDPHRVGEGMSKHVEYKVTYWTDLGNYSARSGCVTRRYSDFEWLWKQLRSTMDGVIVPALPQKTLVPNDDPTSAAIERRRATLSLFIARVSAHPVMRASSDLQIFLEEEDKAVWSTRVPWYERGVTSDALRGVSDWFQNTVVSMTPAPPPISSPARKPRLRRRRRRRATPHPAPLRRARPSANALARRLARGNGHLTSHRHRFGGPGAARGDAASLAATRGSERVRALGRYRRDATFSGGCRLRLQAQTTRG